MRFGSMAVAALLALAAGVVDVRTQDDSGVFTKLLTEMKHELGRAYVSRTPAVLNRVYADDHVVIDAAGETRTEGREIADLASGDRRYEFSDYDDLRARVYGDAAVLSGRGTVKGARKGVPFHTQYRSTNVFIRQAGVWRAVAAHISGVVDLTAR